MHLARLKLAGFRPGHFRGDHGYVLADIACCRGDHARRLRTGQAWRFIIRACVVRLQPGRVLA